MESTPCASLAPLASVSATREVLERFGLSTKKALGQHFLVSKNVVERTVKLAELAPADDVLEIGPGIGTLTQALLASARRVCAIERDANLPEVLAHTCAPWADAFTLIQADALQVGPADLPFAPDKLVANLPYAVAATLVLNCFEQLPSLRLAAVMVQAEVASRMAAKPGTKDYGAFTVKLGLHARPAGQFKVAPGNFFPPPRVDSAVIRLDRVHDTGLSERELHAAAVMVDASFANRRKTIANSCASYFAANPQLGVDAAAAADILQQAGIDPRCRGEQLGLDEFKQLGRVAAGLL